jgi:hypothetical protein
VSDDPETDSVFDSSEFLRRLVKRYQHGHWIGGLRRAFGPVAEVGENSLFGDLETHPTHYLVALWRPLDIASPFLSRWPAKVSIVTPDAQTAARELLADVPRRARMWVAGPEIDWALIARIVILGEPGLQAFQHRELQAFIRTERRATLAAASVKYGGPDDAFEQFANTGPPDSI